MPTTPFFSIVTVSYQNIDGLKRTQKSLKSQEFEDFEWIVIDGGSDDGSKKFLQNIGPDYWQSRKDHGIYDAMNIGLEKAKGEYIYFLNAGDCLFKANILSQISKILQKKRFDFLYGDSYESVAGKHFYKKARSHERVDWGMFTHHQSMFYCREILREFQFNQFYKVSADYDLTLRFLDRAKFIYYWNKPVCTFESGGFSQENAKLGRSEQFQIRARQGRATIYKNAVIFMLQALNYNLRRYAPFLYWGIKKK